MATTTTEINLPDIQATPDQRATAIAAVGIRGLELPLHLDAGDGLLQSTLGTWDLAVSLAKLTARSQVPRVDWRRPSPASRWRGSSKPRIPTAAIAVAR